MADDHSDRVEETQSENRKPGCWCTVYLDISATESTPSGSYIHRSSLILSHASESFVPNIWIRWLIAE